MARLKRDPVPASTSNAPRPSWCARLRAGQPGGAGALVRRGAQVGRPLTTSALAHAHPAPTHAAEVRTTAARYRA